MITLINPAGMPREQRHQLAPRPAQLDNLRMGLLDNGKQNADVMVQEIGKLLRERTSLGSTLYMPRLRPGMDLEARAKYGAFDDVLEELVEKCDVVVNGVGD